MNFKDEAQEVSASLEGYQDLLAGREVKAGEQMEKFDIRIVKVHD